MRCPVGVARLPESALKLLLTTAAPHSHLGIAPHFPFLNPYLFIQKLKAANAPAMKGEVNQEMITGTKPLK